MTRLPSMSARLGVALTALWLAGCAATGPRETWSDPGWSGPALKKVLVVAIENSDGRRRLWEDGMVLALRQQGVEAAPSYQLVPAAQPNLREIALEAEKQGFDGMIANHLVSVATNMRQSPSTRRMEPEYSTDSRGNSYVTMRTVTEPGDIDSEQIADYQTDVYSVNQGGRLIFTAATRIKDTSSVKGVAAKVSSAIVPQLTAQGALASAGTATPKL